MTIRDQINKKFPYRDKASDGGLGDLAHQSRPSDHNVDASGVYHAYDFDHDPDTNGLNCVILKAQLIASGDRRIKYIIFNRKIWSPSRGERNYTGVNAHTQHLHLSVNSSNGDDAALWNLPMLGGATTRIPIIVPVINSIKPLLKVTEPLLNSPLVLNLQKFMTTKYSAYNNYTPTGNYGPKTAEGIAEFQRRSGLLADGVIGPQTWHKLAEAGFRG